jgi:hypothetical protein
MLHVICTAYKKPIALRLLIDSLLLQTDKDWNLYIIYDGPLPPSIKKVMDFFTPDKRIWLFNSPKRLGDWGHPNRKTMLNIIQGFEDDFVLITNHDNYYCPVFVEYMLKAAKQDIAIVYCNTVHSHNNYDTQRSALKLNSIDMGAFIVRYSIAKKVGFNNTSFGADGLYAEECYKYAVDNGYGTVHINKSLFIHN